MKQILKLSVTLLLITAITAAALAGVNAMTKDKIAAAKEAKTNQAILTLFPGSTDIRSLAAAEYTDTTGTVKQVFTTDNGLALEVHPSGFGGEITLMVGIRQDRSIVGIQVISHTETPGLGAVAAANNAAGETFRNSFTELPAGTSSVTVTDIDALSGATITSQAIVDGVNAALACQILQEVAQ